jgi:dTDP-4-amino-4,6-dideoxygalactose transaminase
VDDARAEVAAVSAEYIPFNRLHATGKELAYIEEAIARTHLSGNGPFSERCCRWLERVTGSPRALLTHSGTGALEFAILLAGVGPGDEVIMPSFTFASTANAVALRGGIPVFVDVREDTLNLDERRIEDAITDRTKALFVVHYAGIGAAMDELTAIARRHELTVIEDAAQGVLARYRGRELGSIGALGALSFHETKNVMCGEGGALLVNDKALVETSEIVHEKGTNRQQFFRGQVDRYSWVELGSSFPMSDLAAAFLWAQLEHAQAITEQRLAVWNAYHESLADLERAGRLRRPVVPPECEHNGHIYYLLLADLADRTRFIARLEELGVNAVFHYVPLHSSAAGKRLGRAAGTLEVTTDVSDRLVRLPLWPDMTEEEVERVLGAVHAAV